MKKRMKTCISQMALIAALVLTLSVPVYAAVKDTNKAASGENTANSVHVKVTRASVNYARVGIFPADSEYCINNKLMYDLPGDIIISPAHQYPGQHIRAGFLWYGVDGDDNYIAGRYYYNDV